METARVDVRKLQLLNDRINQTIDALNQVRLSVHGLQHTAPIGQIPTPYGMAAGIGMGQVPFAPTAMPQTVMPQYAAQVNPWLSPLGIGHTPFVQNVMPPWIQQAQLGLGAGLSHSELLDPYAPTRYAQTFPFAYSAVSPFLSVI